jgi:hypothetical protein
VSETLTRVVHYLAGACALAAAVTYIACMSQSQDLLDPDRPGGDKLTTFFFPLSARASDFTGDGWRWRVRAYVAFAAIVPCAVVWASTMTRR